MRAGDQLEGPVTIDETAIDLDLLEDCQVDTSQLDRPQFSPRDGDQHRDLTEKLVISFAYRKREAARKQIDNSRLYAESPMYFYCDVCGVPVAILPEDFTCEVPKHCLQCIELDAIGLLRACIESLSLVASEI